MATTSTLCLLRGLIEVFFAALNLTVWFKLLQLSWSLSLRSFPLNLMRCLWPTCAILLSRKLQPVLNEVAKAFFWWHKIFWCTFHWSQSLSDRLPEIFLPHCMFSWCKDHQVGGRDWFVPTKWLSHLLRIIGLCCLHSWLPSSTNLPRSSSRKSLVARLYWKATGSIQSVYTYSNCRVFTVFNFSICKDYHFLCFPYSVRFCSPYSPFLYYYPVFSFPIVFSWYILGQSLF